MSELSKKFAARLHEICDEMGIPPSGKNRQGTLAKRFGVTPTAAHKWLQGHTWPKMEVLIAICEWSKVRLDWLCHGRGEKYFPTTKAVDERIGYVLRVMQESPEYKIDEIKGVVEVMVAASKSSAIG